MDESSSMSSQPKTLLTPEQYLEIERQAQYKSEFLKGEMFAMAGEMFAMAGAGERHNRLVWNLIASLDRSLRSGPYQGYPSDMRVHVTATSLFTYPDVVVVCGEPQFLDDRRDTLLNPTLIVEVLSPSTEAYDRGRKFEHYRSIASVREYLLVASDRIHVDLYARQDSGQWLLTSASEPEEAIELKSVGCRLGVSDLYEKVEFA
jgi:Uma2 family endonuclease